MYLRSIIILLLLNGLFLSSPTVRATFSEAKPLDKIRGERVEFEKKVHKPFESFYSVKKKNNRTKGVKEAVPAIHASTIHRLFYSEFTFYDGDICFSSSARASHRQRGPPGV
jgi:hypothetical protein